MARRRPRRASSNSAGLIFGGIAAIVLSIGIIVVFGYLYIRAEDQPVLDAETLCPDDGLTAVTAVLLDTTDPISATTATDLRNEFHKLVSSLRVGGRIEIYTLTENVGELTRTFSGCNPGTGENVDEWTGNPRMAQERWEEGFQGPLGEIANNIGRGHGGERSPIMAAIQAIKLNVFAPLAQGTPKHLIVASDMLEHTDAFSFYRDGINYQAYRGTVAQDRFRTSLDDIDIRILAFQREGDRFPVLELAEFWKTWIEANQGTFAGFVRLEGM